MQTRKNPRVARSKDPRVRRRCCKFRVDRGGSSTSNVMQSSVRRPRPRSIYRKFRAEHAYPRPVAVSVLLRVFSRPREGMPPSHNLPYHSRSGKMPFTRSIQLEGCPSAGLSSAGDSAAGLEASAGTAGGRGTFCTRNRGQ